VIGWDYIFNSLSLASATSPSPSLLPQIMSPAIHTPPPSDHASDSRTGDPSRPQSPVDPMDEDVPSLQPPPGTACTQCASTSSLNWKRDKDGSFVCNKCGTFSTHPERVYPLSLSFQLFTTPSTPGHVQRVSPPFLPPPRNPSQSLLYP
jgi:hypothetical protein